MHEISLAFKQLVNALDDISFPEQNLLLKRHEFVLHVRLKSMYKMYPLLKKGVEEFLLDVSPVGKDLSVQNLREHVPYTVIPVIYVSSCKTESYNLSGIVAKQMKLVPTLFPNVADTLKWLKDNGITMSIASSRSSKSIRDFLSGLGIIDDIAYILGAEDVTKPKPDAEPVLKTLDALHYSADEALVVGDMPFDIMMGRNAGTRTCGVTYGNASRRQLEDSGANFVIDDIWELTEIIQNN